MLKGIHLTLMMGPTIAAPVPQPVTDALTSAQVTTSAGQRSGFQLTFTLGKQSLLNRTLLPAGFFDPKVRVIIVATINGMPNVLMDGVITQQSVSPSNEPGQSTLNITGEDVSLVMDLEHRRETHPNMDLDKQVRKILLNYLEFGFVPLVIPPLFTNQPSRADRTPSQASTDLAYINKLAQDAGYVFYIDAGPAPGANLAYWGPEIRVGVPQPALNVNMDAHTNVESLSFTFNGLSRTQLTITKTLPKTNIDITIPVPDIGLLRPPLALKPAIALRKEPLGDTSKLNTTDALLRGLAGTAEAADAINGSGEIDVLRYGRLMKARQLVAVRGAGMAYDGLYFVKSVTHNIKRGAYKQSFTLSRDGHVPNIPRVVA